MGTLVPFPTSYAPASPREQSAKVLILPVLRIERHAEDTDGGRSRAHQRRRSAQQERFAREVAAWESSPCPMG
jgi:hypothetical protein